ncbi:MAG TPA: alcohol dehydrogenase catalytic domain-containing protein [Sporichthyaceae bacterium]|jgi:2-desacetyl-2-hydroxyethyl bacteriochlorophyllide A dehydrogenase|nr:alcohol dehydrogenase catalytic domain-containing protein [Sporichthyaceae bacterium]
MRAIVFQAPGQVALTTVPDPVLLADTDALVQVRAAGICGTDLHVTGGHVTGMGPGTVLGHEFVGTVVAAGSALRRVGVGTEVGSGDFTACGVCWWCDRGSHWHCPHRQFFGTGTVFGPELPGAQAEFVRVPFADTVLSPLPHGVSDAAALLVGDNLATGWIACQDGGVRPADVVAVIGGGPVGQLVSLCAQVIGAAAVVVADPVGERRELARSNGAIGADPAELNIVLDELTDGRGADVVIEAVGIPVGLESALDAVRKGGTVVSVGAHAEPEWPLPLAAAFADEITLRFSIGDSIRARRSLLPLLAAGVLDPDFVFSHELTISQAVEGYSLMRDRAATKALLTFD